MLRQLNKKGFASYVEIIVTSIIFVLASAGIYASIMSLQPQGQLSAQRLKGMYAAKKLVDDLKLHVDATTWESASSPLAPGSTYSNVIDGFNITYNFVDDASLGVRRMRMAIEIPE